MIQSPYITKMKRDVSITYTNYVANTGGILGLCIGFSFISIIEILFWSCTLVGRINICSSYKGGVKKKEIHECMVENEHKNHSQSHMKRVQEHQVQT